MTPDRHHHGAVGESAICGARPYRGDGSLWCTLPPYHAGLHADGGVTFSRIAKGSSQWARRRLEARRVRAMRRAAP